VKAQGAKSKGRGVRRKEEWVTKNGRWDSEIAMSGFASFAMIIRSHSERQRRISEDYGDEKWRRLLCQQLN
jgi:hypothetical protein